MRYINVPVLLNGASYIPPATGINYSSWFIVGFIFREQQLGWLELLPADFTRPRILDATTSVQVVVQILFHHVGSARRRYSAFSRFHLLHAAAAKGWRSHAVRLFTLTRQLL